MAVTLRDREERASGTESRRSRRRSARQGRLKLFLQGLSVLLAFAGALVLLFVGGFAVQQAVVEDGVSAALPDVVENLVSSTAGEPEAAPEIDAEALEDQLQEVAEDHQGVYGIAVLEPGSGTRVSLRGDEQFAGASIGKLPAFAALYRAAARGELDLEEKISIQSGDYQSYGSGSLHAYPEGYSFSLRDTAYYLVNHSDNTAWAMLDRRLGEEKIQADIEDMGLEDSQYQGHLDTFYTTPDDILLLFEKIADPDFTSEEISTEMLDAMTDTLFEDRISEKLPADVRVSHKIGSYGENFGDAGVVFYEDEQGAEHRYYLVVLSEGTGEYEARDAIQEMSLAVYEALTGTRVDPEWSRGKEGTEPESGAEEPPVAPAPPPAPAPTTPPPVVPPPVPAEKAGSTAKPPPQEKPAPKVEPPPATRYDASSYPPPKYGSYYDRDTQDSEDYYYYEAFPEEDSYWEQY